MTILRKITLFSVVNLGFLHSTVTALLDMTNQWCLNIDKGMVSGVIFLDLKKAFDTLDHAILLKKLSDYGVQGQTASWFKSYLKDRQQFCVINGLSSLKNRIVYGVPQGSLLGPPLFLIYINDLPNCLDHSIGRTFADDTNLTFSAVDLSILQTEMSNDHRRIFNWLSSNKLTLNILKTDFMVIGSRQRIATLAAWKSFIKCEWFNVTTGRKYKVSWSHYRPISYLEKSFTKCQTKGGVWH